MATNGGRGVRVGNGCVQMRAELSKNAVPYRINLAPSFGGIYKIKTQTVFLGRGNALPPRPRRLTGTSPG